MKYTLNKLAISIALLSASTVAIAESGSAGYIGGGVSAISVDIDSYNTTGTGLEFSGGYNINQWFGFEGKFIFTSNLETGSSDVAIASLSFGPKFTFQAHDNIALFAKIGITSSSLSFDDFDDDDEHYHDENGYYHYHDNDDELYGLGAAFGFGADIRVADRWSVRISYDYVTANLDGDDEDNNSIDYDIDLSSAAFSVHYNF